MTAAVAAERSELVRALGAVVLTPGPAGAAVLEALGLPPISAADHTAAFVLGLPPFAGIHLGPDGMLGGEGRDRVAGFWRALELEAPEDADHLGVLLLLLAELVEAQAVASSPATRDRLGLARAALFDEHLWSWVPGYLAAVRRFASPAVGEWAALVLELLGAERAELGPPRTLPLALREAPPAIGTADALTDVLDALVAPVRSGFVLTQDDLMRCAHRTGTGFRRGERRFAVKAMVEQDPAAVTAWLAAFARERSAEARAAGGGTDDVVSAWWAERASATASVLGKAVTAF